MEKKERSLYNVLYSLYNIKYMKIPELIDLINDFVFGKDLATEEKLNEKQKKSKKRLHKCKYMRIILNISRKHGVYIQLLCIKL